MQVWGITWINIWYKLLAKPISHLTFLSPNYNICCQLYFAADKLLRKEITKNHWLVVGHLEARPAKYGIGDLWP